MQKRIFIDIGAHPSWTVDAALLPEFKIDKLYCFDPSPQHHILLKEKYKNDLRVSIIDAGMWSSECEMPLYDEGSIGASVFNDFINAFPNGLKVNCKFVCASEWFMNNIPDNTFVILKMNCEASECEILNNLMDTGQYKKITVALVDFDVRKCPSQKHRQSQILKRAKQIGFNALKIWPGGRNEKRDMICNTLSFFEA